MFKTRLVFISVPKYEGPIISRPDKPITCCDGKYIFLGDALKYIRYFHYN